jgi:c-di-AMP phosphodiesterase-like protein
MTRDRFSILDRVRGAFTADGLTVTVSIGVGQGKTMQECESMARQALEMALARGGDQTAIKTVNGFDFYGGRSKGVERRTKVRTRVIANALSDLIRSSDRVLVMGHRQSDLDCLGSAIALTVAARRMGKEAVTVVRRRTTMAGDLYDRYVDAGKADLFAEPDAIIERITPRTLLIITDTHSQTMLDCPEIYEAASRVAIIDHHRKVVNHIQDTALGYHEPSSSSACELVTELLQYMGEALIGRDEADALLAGIMLDTRNFVLHTGVRTFEAAAHLRRLGADTVAVKRMFSGGLEMYQKKCDLVSKAEQYHNTAIVTTEEDYSDCRAVPAQAADELLSIQGIKASFVLCVAGDEVIISARSYGECNVQLIMEALGGGGHLTMAGTQLKNTTVAAARERLCAAIDDYFKNNHAE